MPNRKKFLTKLGAGFLLAGFPALGHAGQVTSTTVDPTDFSTEVGGHGA